MVSKPGWMMMNNSESIDRQIFVGEVLTDPDENKHMDPDKRQRLKIRLRGLHDGMSDEEIPWSGKGSGQQGGGGGMGSMQMYPKGTKVYVTMRDNSPYNLEYGGTAPSTDDTKLGEEFTGDDYGHVHGNVDRAGNKYSQNTKKDKNETTFHHASGSIVTIGNDGTVSISSGSKVAISGKGDISITSDGAVKIGGKTVEIAAKESIKVGGKTAEFAGTDSCAIGGQTLKLAAPTVQGPMPTGSGGSVSAPSPGKATDTKKRDRPSPNLKVGSGGGGGGGK